MSVVVEREEEQAEVEQEVSALELFFDLVFVFAITQVTGFVAHDATWTRFFEGMAILAVLWFAWESFVWLANTAASDEGAVRVVLLAAMGALLIVSLAGPPAFAERHGLIIIIALGESIVSLGVGASGLELDVGLIVGALLGMAVAGAMWWAYFDFVALVAERRLRRAPRDERVRIARDSFTYLHMPMVAGIVLFALGVKKTLAHVDEDLGAVPAVALCGGAALYFLALSAFKRRNIGSFNYPRLVARSALIVLAPIAT